MLRFDGLVISVMPVLLHSSESFSSEISRRRTKVSSQPTVVESLDSSDLPSTQPQISEPQLSEDDFYRSMRQKTPVQFQYFLRDSGLLRALVDTLTWTTAAPAIVRQYPDVVARYLFLSGSPRQVVEWANAMWKSKRADPQVLPLLSNKINFRRLKYGRNRRQVIDLISPPSTADNADQRTNHFIFFVHGGAWGSGSPDMYRVVADPFLKRGSTVAVVGYRTYPDGYVTDQVKDILDSFTTLKEKGLIDDKTKVTVMGHSSGAHILAMALLSNKELRESVSAFVGLGGVYDIPRHYRYECSRGVDRISPLATACGPSAKDQTIPSLVLQSWKLQSPTRVAQMAIKQDSFPKTLICHGERDTVVPRESAISFVDSLQQAVQSTPECIELALLPPTGHVDLITEIMFGGKTRDLVMRWMENRGVLGSSDNFF